MENSTNQISPTSFGSSYFFEGSRESNQTEFSYFPYRFSSSSSASDSGIEELPYDTFSPLHFQSIDDDVDLSEDNSYLYSVIEPELHAKPPPPSYIEHLLLSEPLDYYTELSNFLDYGYMNLEDPNEKCVLPLYDHSSFQIKNYSSPYEQCQPFLSFSSSSFSQPTSDNWQLNSAQPTFEAADDTNQYYNSPEHQRRMAACTETTPPGLIPDSRQRNLQSWLLSHTISEC